MAQSLLTLDTLILAGNQPTPTPLFEDGKPARDADGNIRYKLDAEGRKDYRVVCALPSSSSRKAFDDVTVHVASTDNPVRDIEPHSVIHAVDPVISYGYLADGRGQWWRIDAVEIKAVK